MQYGWRQGFHHRKVDPQLAGERLELLRTTYGRLDADIVLNDARQTTSPLHHMFDWDDSYAAHEWRLHQARLVIGNVTILREEKEPLRAFVLVEQNDERQYQSLEVAMSDDDMRRQVLERARRELDAWRRRYQAYQEFQPVLAAIEELTAVPA